jgi:hypothetical protein
LADPEFAARVARLQDEAIRRAAARLGHTMQGAAETLKRLLKSTSEAVRLRAAQVVIDAGLRVRDQVELQRQVAELRARVDSMGGQT